MLTKMGLEDLLTIPWDITKRSYVKDFVKNALVVDLFKDEVRGRPEQWTVKIVGAAFGCPTKGKLFVSKKPEYLDWLFQGRRNPKHGWNIS